MDAESLSGVSRYFDDLDDPRVVGRCDHLLIDIVMIALVALLGDCDDWKEVQMFGRVHEAWFGRFLELPAGIPSHDTFERLFARLVSERTVKGKTTTETRYYLLSDTDADAQPFAAAVRGHWGIENSAHWVLDVTFGEDANRTSKDHAPENMAILRRLAMNLFRANRERSGIALKNQRKMVGWNPDFVTELITHAI